MTRRRKACRHRGRGALLARSHLFWCGECGAIRKVELAVEGNSFTQTGRWLLPDSDKYVGWKGWP